MKTVVYFVQRADGGPIKIGCSAYLESRIAQLQSKLKCALTILGTAPGSFRDESRLHRQFAEHRLGGEWFADCAEVRSAALHCAKRGKLPPTGEEDREVAMARRYLAGETLQGIANDYGITRERVRQLLRATGIPTLGHRARHCRRAAPVTAFEREIASVYATGTRSPRSICETFNITSTQLNGILRRTKTRKFSQGYFLRRADRDELQDKIVSLYDKGLKVREIAEQVGLNNPETIYRYLHLADHAPARQAGPRGTLESRAAEIIDAYRSGLTLEQVACRFGASKGGVDNLLDRHAAKRTRQENEAVRIAAVKRANARRASHRRASASVTGESSVRVAA